MYDHIFRAGVKTTVESASLLGQTLFQNSSTDTTLTSYAGHIRYILDVDYVGPDEVDVDQNSIETTLTSYMQGTSGIGHYIKIDFDLKCRTNPVYSRC